MPSPPPFDLKIAHQFFSVECFNQAWRLIEKMDRSAEEDDQMIALAHASMWHWREREDCSGRNLSIGYWQLSRVYTLIRQPENARRYGELCLKNSLGDEPFFVAYAYEALARAAMVAGDPVTARKFKEEAQNLAAEVADHEDRALIEKDLETLVT